MVKSQADEYNKPMEEKEYRELVLADFKKIIKSFDEIDPDVAECDLSQGAITIEFADHTKLILSQQPSVKQIWVAAASKGIAKHFNYDLGQKRWVDDKAEGLELHSFVGSLVLEKIKKP